MKKKIKSAVCLALLCLCGVCRVAAQEVEYPDYERLKDSAAVRMMELYATQQCRDVNGVRRHLLDELDVANRVHEAVALPPRRKKALDGRRLNALCRHSSLVFMTMDSLAHGGQQRCFPSASAVALTADGVCVTNFHVLADVILSGALHHEVAHDFMRFVMDAEGQVYPVEKILAADPVNDFVLFKVYTGAGRLVPMPLGEPLEVGEEVYCLAHPQGNLFYLTRGIVARNQSVVNKQNGQVKTEMQITADYGVGASGGPIIDSRGNLAGIVSSTYSLYANPQTGQNFQMAIKTTVPVKLIKECFKQPKR